MNLFRAHMALIKWRISLFAALATGLGYILKTGSASYEILFPMAGVFMLAAGAGALNQYQERSLDARMERTRMRPLASGTLTPGEGLCVSVMFMLYGMALVALWSGPVALALGVFAIIWYNGVYTYLKRLTPFAAVPGALVGAVPPLMGWAAAGGQVTDIRILAVGFFFFIWQVPHFWLLLLRHASDYRNTGLPVMWKRLSEAQLGRITFVWMTAAASASLLLPLFGHSLHPAFAIAMMVLAGWLVLSGRRLLTFSTSGFPPARITVFMLLAMMFLSAGRLLA